MSDDARLIEALEAAQGFLETVTAWIGHEDDLSEVQADVDEALASAEAADTRSKP